MTVKITKVSGMTLTKGGENPAAPKLVVTVGIAKESNG